jgi:hypothetical protein
MNPIIMTLESEGFPVSVEQGVHGTSATIFGLAVDFAIFERLEVTGRREVEEGIWKKTIVDHAPTGNLELRLGDFTSGPKMRDRKSEKLENMLAKCVAAFMRLGRDQVLAVEEKRIREIEDRRRQDELRKLLEDPQRGRAC